MAASTSKTSKMKSEIKKALDKIPPTSDQNLMAALSYAWIISLVMLVVKKNDEYVQFHAKQGLVLWLASLLGFIPVFGWIVWGLAVAGMVIGFVNAWKGVRYELPIVYGLSQKIRF